MAVGPVHRSRPQKARHRARRQRPKDGQRQFRFAGLPFALRPGFVATKHRKVTEYLRYYASPNTFSNALSPIQAAVVRKAFEIVSSSAGDELRRQSKANILQLRARLADADFEVYGDPSPIVCVKMGSEDVARLVSRQLHATGLVANLVEFPAVAKGHARFRLQVMANHTESDIVSAVDKIADGYRDACAELAELGNAADVRGVHAAV